MIDICQFKPDDIDNAIVALGELRDIIVPFFQQTNLEGMGEEDARDCAGHLVLAQHALAAMSGYMKIVLISKDPKQLIGPNGVSFPDAIAYISAARKLACCYPEKDAGKLCDSLDAALYAMRILWSAAGELPAITVTGCDMGRGADT